MGRPAAQLSSDAVNGVLGYLKTAALRGADIFRPGNPEQRLAALEQELSAMPHEFRHVELGEWVARNVTPEGRTRMLATLRRRRADAKPGVKKAVPLRLPVRTADELKALSKQTGLPATMVLDTLVTIARSDDELRRQMVKLGIAFGHRSKGTSA